MRIALLLPLVLAACGEKQGQDTGPADTEPPVSAWDALDWVALGEGDALGDCTSADGACAADLAGLALATDGERLYVEVGFAAAPPDAATFEVLLFPADGGLTGCSFRFQQDTLLFWEAECEATKHDGCHWYESALPASFTWEWVAPERWGASLALADLDLTVSTLKTGVGAAPGSVSVTADFTDRYPDELWITSQAVEGLGDVVVVVP